MSPTPQPTKTYRPIDMPAASMLSYMGIGVNSNADGGKDKDKKNAKEETLPQRVKALLKEAGNKQCAECRSNKPKWMALLQTPISSDQRQLGVFVCNNCQPFHKALGKELCKVKSLKEPEKCKFAMSCLDCLD